MKVQQKSLPTFICTDRTSHMCKISISAITINHGKSAETTDTLANLGVSNLRRLTHEAD